MNSCLDNQTHNLVGDFADEFEQITGSGSEGAQQALEEVYHKVLTVFLHTEHCCLWYNTTKNAPFIAEIKTNKQKIWATYILVSLGWIEVEEEWLNFFCPMILSVIE